MPNPTATRAPEPTAVAAPAQIPTATSTPEPAAVTINNCGVETTYDTVLQRVVATDTSALEVLVALGLQEHVIGYFGGTPDRLQPQNQARAALVERLGGSFPYPSLEAILAAGPDMVFSYGFNESAGLTGHNLRDSGVHSFSFTEACPDFTGNVTLEVMFDDVRAVAEIFGVEDRAEAPIASWEQQIADITAAIPAGEPVRVFYFDSGEEAPFTALSGSVMSDIISRVSTEALAAAAVASSVNIAAGMLFSGWATAAQVIAARRFGEGRRVDVGRLLDVSLLVGVGAGLVVLLILGVGSSLFFAAFGVSDAVRSEGVPYLRVLALAAPLAAATAMLRAVYAGVGETGVAMRMTFLVNAINVPLNYVLIFVAGWGLLGAGLGTAISIAVGCVYMGQFGWRRFRSTYELFRVGHLRHFQEVLPRLWFIGWPETAMLFLGYFSNVLVLRKVALLGTPVIAGMQVVTNV